MAYLFARTIPIAVLTLAVTSRGERMRASGPVHCGVRKPVATGRHRTTPSDGGLARRARRVPCEAACPLSGWLPPPQSPVARRDRRAYRTIYFPVSSCALRRAV